mmetsp:Transcript_22910/g.48289  ORF Transcript_22910/g.48289 Transcript_22910/m.48289 type:complete len:312 (-) Transcript_22910:218-1153(-)
MKIVILTTAGAAAAMGALYLSSENQKLNQRIAELESQLNGGNSYDNDRDTASSSLINPTETKRRRLGLLYPSTVEFKPPLEYLWNGKEIYYQTALATTPTPDKVTRHAYQTMYGKFLLPYYQQNPKMKMLEIGLGCNMKYGVGASVELYKTLFPTAELWEAEFVKRCVEEHKKTLEGIGVLTGDQGNYETLDRWISESGGNFDVVIDDGGHRNCQIWNSFVKLWPEVKPGGLYFIEDMEVAKHDKKRIPQELCDENVIVPEKVKDMIDVLIYEDRWLERSQSDIDFIFCQGDACVLGKKMHPDPESVWWIK